MDTRNTAEAGIYIYDHDASKKLVLMRIEDFYLCKECRNCFNIVLKNQNMRMSDKDD